MLLAVARFDSPDAFAAVNDGNQFCPRRVHFCECGLFGVRFVGERAEFVREICFAAVDFEFAVGAERRHFFRADGEFNHAGVKVLDVDAVVLVILGLQSERVGFDSQIDVFGN